MECRWRDRRAYLLTAAITGEMLGPGTYELVLCGVGDGAPQPEVVAAYEGGILTPRAAR